MKNKKRERALALACCAAMAALMPMMLTRRAGLTFRFSGRKCSASRASRASPTTMARLTPTKDRLSKICFQRSVIGITSKQKYALGIFPGREKNANILCVSSSIQTVLSVSEFHRFNADALADLGSLESKLPLPPVGNFAPP